MSTRYLKIAHTLSWLLVLPGWFRDSNNITNNLKVYVFAFLLSRPCKLCSIDTNILLVPICLPQLFGYKAHRFFQEIPNFY